jgi:hypothetical protein
MRLKILFAAHLVLNHAAAYKVCTTPLEKGNVDCEWMAGYPILLMGAENRDCTSGPVRSKSIRAYCSPLGMPPVKPVKSRHPIPFDSSPEREHVASLRTKFDVMPLHRTLNSSRLVRALEMSIQPISVLIDVDVFRHRLAVFDIFRVNRPVAPYIVGWLLLSRLLRPRNGVNDDRNKTRQKSQRLQQ